MLEASEIDKMSLPERLRAIEQLWDAVCREPGNVASTEWHREILADRIARADRGEAKFLTLAEVQARLRGSGVGLAPQGIGQESLANQASGLHFGKSLQRPTDRFRHV